MSHSFSQNHIHLIFSTKDRANSVSKELSPRMWSYLGGICNNHEIAVWQQVERRIMCISCFTFPRKFLLRKP
jgi:hypothetical protein